MKILLSIIAALLATGWVLAGASDRSLAADTRTPVLVELFTSEGCSSCPPADRFLERLDGQPVPGAEVIVLSEHVDYWNHIGWKDPYSSHFYSDRQSAYARRFALDSVYTPQMVVDGNWEFTGSNSVLASRAFAKTLKTPKIAIHLSSITLDTTGTLRARVETEILPTSFVQREAEVYVAVALGHVESRVSSGENAGRTLAHTAVVRSLQKIAVLRRGESLARDVQLKLERGSVPSNLRLIAFAQEPGQGPIIAATAQAIGTKP